MSYSDSPALYAAIDRWATRGPEEGDDERHAYRRTCDCAACLDVADQDGDA